jgi:hypothetical protein
LGWRDINTPIRANPSMSNSQLEHGGISESLSA